MDRGVVVAGGIQGGKEEDHCLRWEQGLPAQEELTPLNQTLITPILACAFSIGEDPLDQTEADIEKAARHTIQSFQDNGRGKAGDFAVWDAYRGYSSRQGPPEDSRIERPVGVAYRPEPGGGHMYSPQRYPAAPTQGGPYGYNGFHAHSRGNNYSGTGPDDVRSDWGGGGRERNEGGPGGMMGNLGAFPRGPGDASGPESKGQKKARKSSDGDSEEGDSAGGPCPEDSNGYALPRTLKRPRLVWTPQLHKRFVDAVSHLGIKNAVPKTIMQLMNVEGLTRENVASHLQKYRLYLKRMQGLSSEGATASDHLFASTPIPPNLASPHWASNRSLREEGPSGYPQRGPDMAPLQAMAHTNSVVPGLGLRPSLGAFPPSSDSNHGLHQSNAGLGIGPPGQSTYGSGYGGYDQGHGYNVIGRLQVPRSPPRDNRENHDSPRGPSSPSHKILSLFPPSGQ
eukprot:TRINITY_DN11959_c0_g2_i1.p1 TRINITY_DN11959_c0_g2~~TRINITY_DN11959_c0_g2_i1.p1  ORF type:complete len:454 (-),score=60.45 TRINITY_DN11959_c0_g2_i1:572-1933(-)